MRSHKAERPAAAQQDAQPRATCRRMIRIDPEDFERTRQSGGIDRRTCGALLGVSERAVRYWESGQRRIPYAAYRLLKVTTGQSLPWKGWEGFRVRGSHLMSPEGHRFSAGDLSWLSLTFRQAESFRKVYAELEDLRKTLLGSKRVRLVEEGINPMGTVIAGQPCGSPPRPFGPGPHLAPGARRLAGRLIARPTLLLLGRKEVS